MKSRSDHMSPVGAFDGPAGPGRFVPSQAPRQFAFSQIFLTCLMALVLACASVALAGAAWAGEADVVDVRTEQSADGSWRFDVTVAHADEGWDHYADRWDVVAPDGTVLGSRTLHHPHVDEQPFTRSLSGVVIAPSIQSVTIRAHDNVHGLGGAEMNVDLTEAADG